MSGPQFGLVVDFARSGWSDEVFQEFVNSWKSVYASHSCKAVAAYAFDRSIVEVRTPPIPPSHVLKSNTYDKVKRRLRYQGLKGADVRYEVTQVKNIKCLSTALRQETRIFPGVIEPLPEPLPEPLRESFELPSLASWGRPHASGFADRRITALRIRADALTKRVALTQASEQEAKESYHAVLAALEAERARSEHLQLSVSQLQASGDAARTTMRNVCDLNRDLQLDVDWFLETKDTFVIERSELHSARKSSTSPRR
jgi:hypothetical protein